MIAALVVVLGCSTGADASAPFLINTPVPAKRLGAGAIYQAPLSARPCAGLGSRAVLGRQRCTMIPALKHIDTTVRPVVAPDSKALYIAAQDGVLVLRRTAAGVSTSRVADHRPPGHGHARRSRRLRRLVSAPALANGLSADVFGVFDKVQGAMSQGRELLEVLARSASQDSRPSTTAMTCSLNCIAIRQPSRHRFLNGE